MKIKKILINNFRNYDNIELLFNKWGSFFYGENGIGKTNIIEAIYMLSYFTSFRSNNINPLIKWDSETAFVKAELEDEYGMNNLLEIHFSKKKRVAFIIEKN